MKIKTLNQKPESCPLPSNIWQNLLTCQHPWQRDYKVQQFPDNAISFLHVEVTVKSTSVIKFCAIKTAICFPQIDFNRPSNLLPYL